MITNLYAKFLGDYNYEKNKYNNIYFCMDYYFGVNRNRNFKYISDEKIYKKYASLYLVL